ncbi:MAG: hypothetical protein CSA81_00650 [Acidobacteria bacterium]|nr:MAG: hypothetical protein CSA81_00650 [Acidobacteriota bacterium]
MHEISKPDAGKEGKSPEDMVSQAQEILKMGAGQLVGRLQMAVVGNCVSGGVGGRQARACLLPDVVR